MDRNLEAILQFTSLPDSWICDRISAFFTPRSTFGFSTLNLIPPGIGFAHIFTLPFATVESPEFEQICVKLEDQTCWAPDFGSFFLSFFGSNSCTFAALFFLFTLYRYAWPANS